METVSIAIVIKVMKLHKVSRESSVIGKSEEQGWSPGALQ